MASIAGQNGGVPASSIVELRQYTLHPGKRDELIDLFERAFIEGQEAVGMDVIGHFRDLSDPDRFVWVRGFANMAAREQALRAFYEGPLWKAHRQAANATMVDSDNVLLLRPARPGSGFAREQTHGGFIVAMVHAVSIGGEESFTEFARTLEPALIDAGSSVLATFVSEHAENTYPALPIREDENVFVSFARFVDRAAFERYRQTLERFDRWQRPSEVLLLTPTSRSKVR